MTLDAFARLLKETMGLDVASVGITTIERAVTERQRVRRIADLDRYWECVSTSPDELQRLIEIVVVPETWFFRDQQAFDALAGIVLAEWQRTPSNGVLRLLSLPCSTGEEPYSMAMALLDAGLPPGCFRIDAVDIHGRVVAHAQRGAYGRSSFRADDLTFRDRYLEKAPAGYQIAERIRHQVHFQQGNMFAPAFLPGSDLYDVVFCRNVLIYFDAGTQTRSITVLSRLLTPTGFLFVGSSEPGVFLAHEFVSAKVPMAFAFRKAAAVAPLAKEISVTRPRPVPVRQSAAPVPPGGTPAGSPRTRAAAAAPALVATIAPADRRAQSSQRLQQARLMADAGRFVDAARCCQDVVQQHGPSAEAFYLLGLVRDASGHHADAGDYYRKALYLDPHHGDALMQLTLLLEGQGEHADALLLRGRMKRLEQQDA